MPAENGLGGFARGRTRVRDRARGGRGDAPAVGERARQPRFRHARDRLRLLLHLGGEQPREPAHAVRERPRGRSHGGGDLSAATTTTGALRDCTLRRSGARRRAGASSCVTRPGVTRLRPRAPRPAAGARRLRGPGCPGQALARHAREPVGPTTAALPVRLPRSGRSRRRGRATTSTWSRSATRRRERSSPGIPTTPISGAAWPSRRRASVLSPQPGTVSSSSGATAARGARRPSRGRDWAGDSGPGSIPAPPSRCR